MRWHSTARSLDWVLVGASVLLVLISLAMMMSAGQSLFSGLVLRQLAALMVGLVLFWLLVRIPYHRWKRWAMGVYGAGVGGLVIVTALGHVIRGTTSRLEFFGWQLQPSEFMKAILVVALAWLLSRYKSVRVKAAVQSAVLILIPVGLVLTEPDAGMAALMLMLWGGVLVFAGLPWRYLISIGAIAAIAGVAAWHFVLLPYQKDRLLVFINPGADPLAAGYNVTQSMIAFGSGEFFGRGLGHGPQSQLQFLPERHTDFILASLGEELGFVGVLLVFGLYVVLLWRIIRIARETRDPFGQLLSMGTFFVLLTGFTVSAGMNMGLLPVTGIPLPLLSYGGSNLVATFFLLGLVQSVHVSGGFMQNTPPEIEGIV